MHKRIFVERIHDAIGEGMGEATLCWSTPPKGSPDNARLSQLLYRTVTKVMKVIREET